MVTRRSPRDLYEICFLKEVSPDRARRRTLRESKLGTLGGRRTTKIYGELDCPSALRRIERGCYAKCRVVFLRRRGAGRSGRLSPLRGMSAGEVRYLGGQRENETRPHRTAAFMQKMLGS